jgi:hypothetical protein
MIRPDPEYEYKSEGSGNCGSKFDRHLPSIHKAHQDFESMEHAMFEVTQYCNHLYMCIAYDWGNAGVNLKFASNDDRDTALQYLPLEWDIATPSSSCSDSCVIDRTLAPHPNAAIPG